MLSLCMPGLAAVPPEEGDEVDVPAGEAVGGSYRSSSNFLDDSVFSVLRRSGFLTISQHVLHDVVDSLSAALCVRAVRSLVFGCIAPRAPGRIAHLLEI